MGTNVITCTATNSAGTNVCSFNVIVRDAEAPVFTNCPADLVLALPPLSNSVAASYSPAARDNCGTNGMVIVCAPPSGTYFAPGTNNVACTATDAAGNVSSSCSFKVIVALPEFSLVASGLPPVSFGTVAWGDYDNDGLLDVVLTGGSTNGLVTQVWRNTGGGFVNANAGLPGLNVSTAVWGDFDNDGRLDLALAGNNGVGRVAQIWRNTVGGFVNINAGLTGVDDASLAWGDFDNDGKLDLLLTGYTGGSRVAQVWRNLGNNTFSNINAGLTGLSTGGAAWGDFNRDGRLDILLTGLDNGSVRRTELWRNTGTGFLKETTPFPGVSASAVAWGDFDNDGWPDLAITGNTGAQNIAQVWRNLSGTFSNINAALPAVSESSVAWGDYENDGRMDLLLTGSSAGSPLAQIWRNTGSNFVLTPSGLSNARIGKAAWGDYDNDGRLDVVLVGQDQSNTRVAQVWHNNFTGAINSLPTAPAGLTASINGPLVQLRWNSAMDPQTPSAGLSYNLSVGTTPNGTNIVNPHANRASGWRRLPALGNVTSSTNATLDLPLGTYYWAVQAVDGAWAGGPFSTNGTFQVTSATVLRIVYIEQIPSGILLRVQGSPNETLQIQWNAIPGPGGWNPLTSGITDGAGLLQHTNTGLGGVPRRFYRAVRP